MVKGVVDDAIGSGINSEKASVATIGQGADLNHVVTAVAEAEATLQTVVAVRERIIEAYKDILRMPI
jgi:flagellar hook-basal body complex protein FliE